MKIFLHHLLLVAGVSALALLAAAIYVATPPTVAALRNIELASSRLAALIGETESDGKKPFTVARLVATSDATLATAKPVLQETERTVPAVRPVLQESKETIKAVRPVLDAATSTVKRSEEAVVRMDARVDALLASAGSSAAQVDHALPDFLDCSGANRNCLFNRWAGLSWQAEQAMRAVASGANRFEAALPTFLETWDRIGKNSDKTTQATAEVMGNVAAPTKPLPTWMRLGLTIAPPVVQVGATVVTTMPVRGNTGEEETKMK